MKELRRIWQYGLWLRILTLTSIALLVWGFVLLPLGMTDGSMMSPQDTKDN